MVYMDANACARVRASIPEMTKPGESRHTTNFFIYLKLELSFQFCHCNKKELLSFVVIYLFKIMNNIDLGSIIVNTIQKPIQTGIYKLTFNF